LDVAARAGDKRTLVLFLFGALIALPGFLPETAPVSAPQVCVETDRNGYWQLWSGTGEGSDTCAPSDRENRGQALFAAPADAALPPALAFFADRPLPINRADVHTLTLLPGIGPRLAEALSSERQRLGAFAGPDDLERVAGIGPATVQRLRPLVSFE
jgi:predicted flap endonuclease-1-like 5' DNA nuclease